MDADANNTTTLATLVQGAAGALVTAGPRDPGSGALAAPGLDRLAFYTSTENDVNGSHVTRSASTSKRSLATGGADEGGLGLIEANSIDFDSDVIILAGRNPLLIIDEAGNIAKQVNVTATVGANTVTVDPIMNMHPGNVIFATGGDGTTVGSGGLWEFQDNFERVTLLNFSKKDLVVDDINVINTTVDPPPRNRYRAMYDR